MDQVTMRDGRVLDVHVSGRDGDRVLVFFHGTPGSGLPSRFLQRAAHERDLRVVQWSRPGYGGSSRLPGRRVIDVVADTVDVLAHVGAEECVVGGASGGAPHALACGAHLDSARAVLCTAGVGPFDAEGLDFLEGMGQDNVDEFGAASAGEDVLRSYLEGEAAGMGEVTVQGILQMLSTLLPPVDRAVITGELAEDLEAGMREALRTGIDGWLDDDLAFVAPWGYDLADIDVPVTLWHGSEDLMTPFAHGRWLAGRVPGSESHLEDGEGHLSLTVGHVDQMLDHLVRLAGWS